MGKVRASTNSTPRRSVRRPPALERLSAEESRDLLRRLFAAHPELLPEAEQMARSLAGEIALEGIADEVEDGLRALDLDDLNDRAGTHYGEYTDPTEAAWELLQEVVDPFLADMRRQMEVRLTAAALEMCKGIVLGLYRARSCRDDQVLGWAPDFPQEIATSTIRGFVEREAAMGGSASARCPLDKAFVDEHVPDWRPLVEKAQECGRTASPAGQIGRPAPVRQVQPGRHPRPGPRRRD